MKVVAAYLLAHLAGNASPSAADISKILSAGKFFGAREKGYVFSPTYWACVHWIFVEFRACSFG
jgi:hypothetical protein